MRMTVFPYKLMFLGLLNIIVLKKKCLLRKIWKTAFFFTYVFKKAIAISLLSVSTGKCQWQVRMAAVPWLVFHCMMPKQVRKKKGEEKKVSQERSKFSTSKVIFHCENLNLSQSTCHFFERKLLLADMNRRSTETTDPEEWKRFQLGVIQAM